MPKADKHLMMWIFCFTTLSLHAETCFHLVELMHVSLGCSYPVNVSSYMLAVNSIPLFNITKDVL